MGESCRNAKANDDVGERKTFKERFGGVLMALSKCNCRCDGCMKYCIDDPIRRAIKDIVDRACQQKLLLNGLEGELEALVEIVLTNKRMDGI